MTAQVMEIVVTCRSCAREFEPSPEDLRRGKWRTCPDCRAPPRPLPRRRPLADHHNLPRPDDEPSGAQVKGQP